MKSKSRALLSAEKRIKALESSLEASERCAARFLLELSNLHGRLADETKRLSNGRYGAELPAVVDAVLAELRERRGWDPVDL